MQATRTSGLSVRVVGVRLTVRFRVIIVDCGEPGRGEGAELLESSRGGHANEMCRSCRDDAFSNLMTEVFGDTVGKGTRSAVGMAELPFGIPVEVEMIVEITD